MKRTIGYKTYLDRVWGCFLGKTVSGTLGAPYEGVKMPMELPFSPEMINTMLPNDDLDLQILWLDVLEKYGADFTAHDLQSRFCEYCDYSPGEYAIMRKNYQKGIYPPYSGDFCNDFYKEGMGCPIRSEIWACVCPGDPARAAELASRDGILDHSGESVYAERFFAALESEAFFEDDIFTLIEVGLKYVPSDCKFRVLVNDTVRLCREYGKIKPVLRGIQFRYGHPDCTNMFQNMGITLASLILGEYDIIKTSMDALNCGFDTDCTCASAGSVIGIVRGAGALMKEYNLTDVRYVLSVRSDRRSDTVYDLCEDICALGAEFARRADALTAIENAPEKKFPFEKRALEFSVAYSDSPSVAFGGSGAATIYIKNNTGCEIDADVTLSCEYPLECSGAGKVSLASDAPTALKIEYSVAKDAELLREKNIISVNVLCGKDEYKYSFGISGAKRWRAVGPIWKTEPSVGETELVGKNGYWGVFPPAKNDGEMNDIVRDFHLNFAIDTETEYFTPEELFEPMKTGFDGKYAVTDFDLHGDSFRLEEISPFSGPCVFYLAQKLIAPEEMTVCIQLGYSSPFTLFINGETAAKRDGCNTWTSENVHLTGVKLKAGENRIVLRVTKVNGDCKFNVIYSKGATCAEQYVCFGTKKI